MITPTDRLLLRAVFQKQQSCDSASTSTAWLAAFEAWQAQVDLDRLPLGHFQFLPLLHQQLERGGVAHPWMGRLKGMYRRSWTLSQLTAHRLPEWLAALRSDGVPTVAVGYSDELSGRPVTLAVPAAKADVAVAALQGCGLAPTSRTAQIRSPEFRSWVPLCRLRSGDGCELVVRWHVLDECPTLEADERLWRTAVPGKVSGVDAMVMEPTEALLVACVSALRRTPEMLAHVLEAGRILQASEAVAWERIEDLASEFGVSRQVRRALTELHETLGLDIPAEYLLPEHTGGARCCEAAVVTGLRGGGLLQAIVRHLQRFHMLSRAQGVFPGPAALLSYLQHSWGLANRRTVARQTLARLMRRRSRVWGAERREP